METGKGLGRLPYWMLRDDRGLWQGGQPPWTYLQDLAPSAGEQMKGTIIRRLLAQLPSHVSFHFVFSPRIANAALVRDVFEKAGFHTYEMKTYLCQPPAGEDLIAALTGKSIRTNLRQARRDLDLVELSAEEFFAFQDANLKASGKKSYRDDNADRIMLKHALARGQAQIIAARRKPDENCPAPVLDAAIACLWDRADGTYKLWRITNRSGEGENKPHLHGVKFLFLAAMENARAKDLLLDTDGSTPGLAKLYETFGPGIFEPRIRLHFERKTLWAHFVTDYPSIIRLLAPGLNFLARFDHHPKAELVSSARPC
ncbi:MAG TPA: hypothetical protein VFI23_08070 [Rhizomicrobium sp.]|nr:hypothetical protein [Rhizomicrobium sp.]